MLPGPEGWEDRQEGCVERRRGRGLTLEDRQEGLRGGRGVQGAGGSPWRAQRRPTLALLCPHMQCISLRVLTRAVAWTEPGWPDAAGGAWHSNQDLGGHTGAGDWISQAPTSLSQCSRLQLQQRTPPSAPKIKGLFPGQSADPQTQIAGLDRREKVSPWGSREGQDPTLTTWDSWLQGGRRCLAGAETHALHPWVASHPRSRATCPALFAPAGGWAAGCKWLGGCLSVLSHPLCMRGDTAEEP